MDGVPEGRQCSSSKMVRCIPRAYRHQPIVWWKLSRGTSATMANVEAHITGTVGRSSRRRRHRRRGRHGRDPRVDEDGNAVEAEASGTVESILCAEGSRSKRAKPSSSQRLAPNTFDDGPAHPRAIGAAERLQRLHAGAARSASPPAHSRRPLAVRQASIARGRARRSPPAGQTRALSGSKSIRCPSSGRRCSAAVRKPVGEQQRVGGRHQPVAGRRRSPASASSAGTTSAGSTTSSPGGTAARSRPTTADGALRRSACGVLEVRVAEPVAAVQQVARGLVELRREVARGRGDQRQRREIRRRAAPAGAGAPPARGGGRAPGHVRANCWAITPPSE